MELFMELIMVNFGNDLHEDQILLCQLIFLKQNGCVQCAHNYTHLKRFPVIYHNRATKNLRGHWGWEGSAWGKPGGRVTINVFTHSNHPQFLHLVRTFPVYAMHNDFIWLSTDTQSHISPNLISNINVILYFLHLIQCCTIITN